MPLEISENNVSGGKWILRVSWAICTVSKFEEYWITLVSQNFSFTLTLAYLKLKLEFQLNALIKCDFKDESVGINGIWGHVTETRGEISLWTKSKDEHDLQYKIG